MDAWFTVINTNNLPMSFCSINSHLIFSDIDCNIPSALADVSISSGNLNIDTSAYSTGVNQLYLCAFNDGDLIKGATLIEYAVCGAEELTLTTDLLLKQYELDIGIQ